MWSNRQASLALTSNLLMKYRLVRVTSIELNDMMQEINTFDPSPAFVSMLIFVKGTLEEKESFWWYMGENNGMHPCRETRACW